MISKTEDGVDAARSPFHEYFITGCGIVGAVLAATIVRIALNPLVGSSLPFVAYFGVALWVAWYKGFWPAAFSITISIWAGTHFILTKGATGILTSARSESVATLGFAVISLSVSFLIDFQRRILHRAKAAERAQAIAAAENARLLKQAELTNDELRRANADLELFAYSASHDLQEPLRTISLSAQLLSRTTSAPAGGPDLVGQILTATRRMDSLMQDILTYIGTTKVEVDTLTLVDSGLVLSSVLSHMQGSVAESEAVITSEALPVVAMQENRLAQVFQNLIGNAIKYRGKEVPRVHVSACRDGEFYVFSVADNGLGIDAKFNEQIFGLFKRLHTQAEYEGSGIGLSICQRIVEGHGGRIWIAQSDLGKGSTFCFSVPAR